jgi:predicted O-methyltransferase YrrM
MSSRTLSMNDEIHGYLLSVGVREHPELEKMRREAAEHERGRMQISAEQGALMQMLVRLQGARRCVEVGTFTGYSALAVALALPEDGELIACDVSEEFTDLGKPHWAAAGVDHKIDLRIAPAAQTLEALLAERGEGTFDFAFIDADKENYQVYYELLLRLLRPGGCIGIDNVLWGGRTAQAPSDEDTESTKALRELNAFVHADARVDVSMVPIGDGLTLARKR